MRPLLAAAVLSSCAAACTSPQEPVSLSLINLFEEATVEDAFTPEPRPPALEWSFNGESTVEAPEELAATAGWKSLNGIDGLEVRDGALAGRTTDIPLLVAAAPGDLDAGDRLHAIEIRMRVSAGTRLGVSFGADEKLEVEKIVKDARDSALEALNTEITPDNEFHTYKLTGADSSFSPSFPFSRIKHVLIRPTDAADASFEIESIDLVSLKEHLGSIASGIGWRGLGEIYRETIVARSPEKVSVAVDLPSAPFLELAIGTVEDGPVTFHVEVSGSRDATTLLERTISTPGRWEEVPLDLAGHAGQRVTLSLRLAAENAGAIGFWGTPVVRNRAGRVAMEPSTPARETLAGGDTRPPQGVILIVADTLRRDHLEAYGHERPVSPVLTRMAAEGTLFRDTISQGTWTKVSVASILTSLYPTTHGIKDTPDRLPASVTTLAEAYNRAGYATFATSSVPFTGKLTNLHQGVEVLHERSSIDIDEAYRSKTARPFVDRLLSWLEEHRDVPFFAMLHAFDPHSPFEPYAPYGNLWMDTDTTAAHRENMEKIKEFIKSDFMKVQSLPKKEEIEASSIDTAAFVAAERDWYDGSIRAMDVEIGRLFERLKELGLDDRTLVAFISDHGEEFLEHGNHFHGNNTYGEMVNVPLILWGPGLVPAGLAVDETVRSIDLMPTLVQLSRLPQPEQMQGQSLVPLMANDGKPSAGGWRRLAAFTERHIAPSDTRVERDAEEVESMAIITEGWKLIRNTTRPAGWPEFELYDHHEDPLNLEDVAGANPEVVERLAVQLAGWHEGALAAQVEAESSTEGLSTEDIKRLRSLGYVQ